MQKTRCAIGYTFFLPSNPLKPLILSPMRRILLLPLLLIASLLHAQTVHHFYLKDLSHDYVRILFAGDAMQHSTQFQYAWDTHTRRYNYEPNFRYLQPYIRQADINIVNVETTFPGYKYSGYPRFRTPDAFFYALTDAGFDIFALANNHVNDSGQSGLQRTLKLMSQYPTMGAYINAEQREKQYPILIYIAGLKIAVFNATYGTNQIPPVAPNIVNYIDTEQIELDIARSLKDTTIDLRIMFIHWGTEYQLLHNPYQHGLAQWFADLGFDVIIGSHPHVVQDQETITAADGRQVPVVYSLGNLVSNQRWKNSNGGIIALLDINIHTKQLQNLQFVPFYVHKGSLLGEGDPSYPNTANYYCIPTQDYLDGKLPFLLNETAAYELKLHHQLTNQRLQK